MTILIRTELQYQLVVLATTCLALGRPRAIDAPRAGVFRMPSGFGGKECKRAEIERAEFFGSTSCDSSLEKLLIIPTTEGVFRRGEKKV
jgi:hypothetical protein